MNEAAEVFLWGRRIGVTSRLDGVPYASFAYDAEFRDFGIEPSPLRQCRDWRVAEIAGTVARQSYADRAAMLYRRSRDGSA